MRATFATALAASLLLPGAAPAAEPWGKARTVEPRSDDARLASPAVGVDERGYIVAAWTERTGAGTALVGARRTPRRGFARPFTFDPPRAAIDCPAIEFDGKRTALIGYRRSSLAGMRVGALAMRPDGGRTRRIVFVDARTPTAPRFADPPFDRPLLAWGGKGGDRDIQLAEASAEGDFDATVRFDLDGVVGPVAVAAEPQGRGLLAYVRRAGGAPGDRVVVARREPGTNSFDVVAVSAPGATPREPVLAVAPSGRAVVAWREGGSVMTSVRLSSADGFGPPRRVAGGARDQLRAVATSDGRLLLAWRSTDRRLYGAQVGLPAGPLSRPGAPVLRYALRADERGGATAAWIEGGTSGPGGVVRAVAITRSGTVGKVQRLSPNGRRAGALALGVGEQGDAVALWTDAGGDRLRAARRPA